MPALRLIALCVTAACSGPADAGGRSSAGYEIVNRFPHDSLAYTQGLVFDQGTLYESLGLLGRSELRRVDLETGRVVAATMLDDSRFGEGIAVVDSLVYQLTWKAGTGYVHRSADLARVDSFPYAGEGWGLTTDGRSLIMSDGSDTLRFLDPHTHAVRARLGVRFSSGLPATKLNELEYMNGEIFANIYQSDWIVRIDAATGRVTDVIDLDGLLPAYSSAVEDENVLNGIAYMPSSGHLLVTGKRWPVLFELRLTDPPGR